MSFLGLSHFARQLWTLGEVCTYGFILASSYIDYYYLLNYYKIFTFTLMRVKVKKCLLSLFRSFHSHFSFVNLPLFTLRHRWASPATPSHSLLQEKSPLI